MIDFYNISRTYYLTKNTLNLKIHLVNEYTLSKCKNKISVSLEKKTKTKIYV